MHGAKRLGGILIAVAAIVALKFYDKVSARDEMLTKLTGVCEKDAGCMAAVNQHFDSCFEDNYDLGSRRRASSLNTTGFLSCFNQRAGTQHFSVSQQTVAH